MTAHELARKLLEGPDLPVVYIEGRGAYSPDPDDVYIADNVEPLTVYEWRHDPADRVPRDLMLDAPGGVKPPTNPDVLEVRALRLR